ncbi:hypothetical protein Tco_1285124 [Tanacetum coccineum]
MSSLKFAETHNLVVFLSKPEERAGFEEIFWAIAKAKTGNMERQIQALVDKKKVIITDCLPNDFLIHTILQCLGTKTSVWNEFSSTMASAIIWNITPLFATMMVQAYMDEDSAAPTDSYPTPIITQPSSSKPQKKQSRRKYRKDNGPKEPITDDVTNEEHVPTPSYDPSQSGEDRMKLHEWMNLCTELSDRVLALENTNTSQAAEIVTLKERVKKLEKKRRSRTYKPKRLYKAEVTLVDETQGGNNEEDSMFDTGVLDGDEVFVEPVVTTATVTTAATIVDDELTLAKTMIAIKVAKPKAITTAATTITPAPASRPKISFSQSQLPQDKDKGKAKMDEPEIPLKRKDQIALNEEVARRLEAEMQAKLKEEQRVAKQRYEEASLSLWDNTQAMIEADFKFAQRLQAKEQGELTIEERTKLFVELMNRGSNILQSLEKRKSEENHLPKLKGGIKCMDSEVVESSKKAKAYIEQESRTKRAGDELEQEKAKKQKIDDAKEEAELRKLINIVPDEEEVAIDAIPLATKHPSIVDWKIIKERKVGFYQIIRADGSSKRYSTFIHMMKDVDREDLETLWKLVKAKHGDTRLEEDYERVLWGDLKAMFEPDIRSEVWTSLQGYKVTVWKLFDSCRVHFGKLNPRYIGPSKILAKKCFVNEPLAIPLDEIQIVKKLNFIEEPVEIMDRAVKRIKQRRILIMKVCWNLRRGPEFTWEREDQMKKKYPHLFVNPESMS